MLQIEQVDGIILKFKLRNSNHKKTDLIIFHNTKWYPVKNLIIQENLT